MFEEKLLKIMEGPPPAGELWQGACKIPWDQPEFSRRMLAEHLSQDHNMASRKAESIARQVAWIQGKYLARGNARLLDVACGPGLYAAGFRGLGHTYLGIDFSPASIDYAREQNQHPDSCRFVLGDIRRADFGRGHDLAMLLYGELNVFSPDDCRAILAKMHGALKPGGRLLLEVHTEKAVREIGQGMPWNKSAKSLFSDQPHLCLIENHWYEEPAVALQVFYVVDLASGGLSVFRSTNQAYGDQEYEKMLASAGFGRVTVEKDWPGGDPYLMLISAVKE